MNSKIKTDAALSFHATSRVMELTLTATRAYRDDLWASSLALKGVAKRKAQQELAVANVACEGLEAVLAPFVKAQEQREEAIGLMAAQFEHLGLGKPPVKDPYLCKCCHGSGYRSEDEDLGPQGCLQCDGSGYDNAFLAAEFAKFSDKELSELTSNSPAPGSEADALRRRASVELERRVVNYDDNTPPNPLVY